MIDINKIKNFFLTTEGKLDKKRGGLFGVVLITLIYFIFSGGQNNISLVKNSPVYNSSAYTWEKLISSQQMCSPEWKESTTTSGIEYVQMKCKFNQKLIDNYTINEDFFYYSHLSNFYNNYLLNNDGTRRKDLKKGMQLFFDTFFDKWLGKLKNTGFSDAYNDYKKFIDSKSMYMLFRLEKNKPILVTFLSGYYSNNFIDDDDLPSFEMIGRTDNKVNKYFLEKWSKQLNFKRDDSVNGFLSLTAQRSFFEASYPLNENVIRKLVEFISKQDIGMFFLRHSYDNMYVFKVKTDPEKLIFDVMTDVYKGYKAKENEPDIVLRHSGDIVKEIKLVPNSDQLIRVTLQKKNSEIINDECKAKISSNNDRDGFFISIRSCKLDGNSEFTFKVNWDNLDIKRNSIGRY